MKCHRCNAENREGMLYCENCGASLNLVCPSCGAATIPGKRFCGACGAFLATGPASQARVSASRRVVAVVASLSAIGAGHFVLGHVRRGILWWVASASASIFFLVALSFVPLLAYLGGLLVGVLVPVAAAVDVIRLHIAKGPLPSWKKALAGWAVLFIIGISWSTGVRTFYVQAFKIPSGSMIPTLLAGDHILVNKFIYYVWDPQRGDVIVFKYPWDENRDFVRRIIAVGGDEVAIKDRSVFINGRPLQEPYAIYSDARPSGGSYEYGPVVVPPGSYFVMGDNRDNSQDSRFWGFLKRDKIRGKAVMIYWSRDPDTGVRWSRFGQVIP